jgi:hypothetical protein
MVNNHWGMERTSGTYITVSKIHKPYFGILFIKTLSGLIYENIIYRWDEETRQWLLDQNKNGTPDEQKDEK